MGAIVAADPDAHGSSSAPYRRRPTVGEPWLGAILPLGVSHGPSLFPTEGGARVISSSTIGGYALEEVIAKMLADNGYRLILSDAEDPERLLKGKNGLLVRGRGAEHQADGLGDLLMPVPFSEPVRLFAEAKNRVAKTGIEAVRNGFGVVSDVNQFQPLSRSHHAWNRRNHHYRYSLFSTSGFTPPAQTFAVAHHISLIDLSGSSFAALRRAVEEFSIAARELCIKEGLTAFPVGQMRAALRVALGTGGYGLASQNAEARRLLEELDPSTSSHTPLSADPLLDLASALAESATGDMVLGFPAGPFVLVLRPDDATTFRDWVARAPDRVLAQVRSTTTGPEGDWVLLVDALRDEGPVVLRFSTPDAVTDWLFSSGDRRDTRLSELESGLLSSIVIYQDGRSVTLDLDLNADEEEAIETWTTDERMAQRRRLRVDQRFTRVPDELLRGWTEGAAWQFLEALLREDPGRTSVLLTALDDADGWVSRDAVYRHMEYESDRSIRGYTKPYNRHRDTLVAQGLLVPGLPPPLSAEYPDPGGWAAGFRLDRGLARALRSALGGSPFDEDEE